MTSAFQFDRVLVGDCRETLASLPAECVQTCVTSPPYWGLRDYGHERQIGLEPTPEQYVEELVGVFRQVRRVLRADGTLWLNIGDSYAEKNLVGIPWRLAFGLQADGWLLRSDIIWNKPNPTPDPCTDRPSRAHEYVFLFARRKSYVYDGSGIRERYAREYTTPHNFGGFANRSGTKSRKLSASTPQNKSGSGPDAKKNPDGTTNARSVWTIAKLAYDGEHFATMPPTLASRCILAGSKLGDVVLDPFLGSGTVGEVAESLGRRWIGCELNPDYERLAKERTAQCGLRFGGPT